jgi:hypothetical protein
VKLSEDTIDAAGTVKLTPVAFAQTTEGLHDITPGCEGAPLIVMHLDKLVPQLLEAVTHTDPVDILDGRLILIEFPFEAPLIVAPTGTVQP